VQTTSVANLAEQVVARCQELAAFSEDAERLRRTFLSRPMHDVHRLITSWVEPVGARVRIDAAGNFRALYPGHAESSPRLLIGSHLDTVPNAGCYDGILGVVLAVAVIERLQGTKLPFAIEVVGFSEEEGVRFGKPFIGSRAIVGRLDEQLLATKDTVGTSVAHAIELFGLNPAEIPHAVLPDSAFAYLEFHIEQGPVLESLGRPLGVVEAIAGQSRLEMTFVGRSNHAGTTPMSLRFDALAGAAEWITAVESAAQAERGLVATVGIVEARPGAANVIAGEVRASLDVRHREDAIRDRAVKDLIALAERIAARRSLSVRCVTHLDQAAVPMDSALIEEIEEAIRKTGSDPHHMVSGAGHDAMILAEKVPSAMIFLRTPGGISHDPAESVLSGDIALAIESGIHLLRQLASSDKFQLRTHRE
jgi:allantoate deiminase